MSSGDKRKVSTDALETLGKIHTREEKRDAIHLAVEPVRAGGTLMPGQRITVINGVAYAASADEALGIVDPFLTKSVWAGERFWFVMNPRMVHSLRHVWTHPSFPDKELPGETHEHPDQLSPSQEKAMAQIRQMASELDCSYERLMEGAKKFLETGSYLHFGFDLDYSWDTDTFWRCYEQVTGKALGGDRGFFFSCSC